MSKSKNIVVLLIIVVLAVGCAYLFSDKLFLKRKNVNGNNNENKSTKCSYSVLPNPYELSDEEKTDIVKVLSESNSKYEIDVDSISFTTVNKYAYQVEFELAIKEGSYKLIDVIWKKDGKWTDYGAGSGYLLDDYERIEAVICNECNDACNL